MPIERSEKCSDKNPWNMACHDRLRAIYESIPLTESEKHFHEAWYSSLQNLHDTRYQSKENYGDLYANFMRDFKVYVETELQNENNNNLAKLKEVFNAIYMGTNPLPHFAEKKRSTLSPQPESSAGITPARSPMISPQPSPQASPYLQPRQGPALQNLGTLDPENNGKYTPRKSGSMLNLARESTADFVDFQDGTNMPHLVVHQFSGTKNNAYVEIRIAMQTELIDKKARINPLFRAWIQYCKNPDVITHVYFCHANYKRKNYEGRRETKLTQALIDFGNEAGVQHKCAVIVLPSAHGIMSQKKIFETGRDTAVYKLFNSLRRVLINTDQNTVMRHDFAVSDYMKTYLCGNPDQYNQKIIELLKKSFEKFGFPDVENKNIFISTAEAQAIFFYFINNEFKNFVLKTVSEKAANKIITHNSTCKHDIDRGWSASLYFNLIGSLENKNPITEKSFTESIHAAAQMVKGRDMNSKFLTLWNAIHYYIENKDNNKTTIPDWLIDWRDLHCPKHRRAEIFERAFNEAELKIQNNRFRPDNTRIPDFFDSCSNAVNIAKDCMSVLPSNKLIQVVRQTGRLAQEQDKAKQVIIAKKLEELALKLQNRNPTFDLLVVFIKRMIQAINGILKKNTSEQTSRASFFQPRHGVIGPIKKAIRAYQEAKA